MRTKQVKHPITAALGRNSALPSPQSPFSPGAIALGAGGGLTRALRTQMRAYPPPLIGPLGLHRVLLKRPRHLGVGKAKAVLDPRPKNRC